VTDGTPPSVTGLDDHDARDSVERFFARFSWDGETLDADRCSAGAYLQRLCAVADSCAAPRRSGTRRSST
jgi:hypothetical protein